MSQRSRWALLAALLVVAFIYFDGPKEFRKAIQPIRYWSNQRASALEQIQFYQNQLKWCMLEFENLRDTGPRQVAQNRLNGMTPDEARAEFLDHVNATKEACNAMRELLALERKSLEEANQNLTQF